MLFTACVTQVSFLEETVTTLILPIERILRYPDYSRLSARGELDISYAKLGSVPTADCYVESL
jgi:hypothetical protein